MTANLTDLGKLSLRAHVAGVRQRHAATSMWAWLGTHPGDFDNLNSTFRVNNAVKYQSPKFYGLQVSSMFAPGGVAGNFVSGRVYTLGLKYVNGPLSAALAY